MLSCEAPFGWNAKRKCQNHLLNPIPQPSKFRTKTKCVNCSLASFFKCDSLSRKSLRFSYLNAQIPPSENLRTPSSCRAVFHRPPAHPVQPRVKPRRCSSHFPDPRASVPSHLPVDRLSSTLRTPESEP